MAKAVKLNNGLEMPELGLGVWRAETGILPNLIVEAVRIGYRHFDCAGS